MKHIRKSIPITESADTAAERIASWETKENRAVSKGLQNRYVKKMFKEINESTELIMLEDVINNRVSDLKISIYSGNEKYYHDCKMQ